MFNAGDAVVHPNLGAGIVISVVNKTVQKKNKRFYRIEIVGKTKTMVMLPADKAEDLGLRPAISSDEMDSVWQVLAEAADDLPDDNKARKAVLEEKLQTLETQQLAELVRDLTWRKMQGKTINSPGRTVGVKAMDFLVSEIAVMQDKKIDAIRSRILNILDTNLSQRMA